MKLTSFLYASSTLLLAAPASIIAQGLGLDVLAGLAAGEPVWVNAHGEVVDNVEHHWGRVAVSQKGSGPGCPGMKMDASRLDASGRLGKRQQTCPTGYTLSCEGSYGYPCCPNSTPLCCPNSSVCCGVGQFCQGANTCCSAGQIGCGEACCNAGETCCGTNCCASGFTCSADNTCTPPPSSSGAPPPSSSSRSSSTIIESTKVAYGQTTAYDTITHHVTETSTPTSSSGGGGSGGDNGGNNGGNGSNGSNSPSVPPTTVIGIVSGCLGGLSAILAGVAAWFYRAKKKAEEALACQPAAAPPVEEYKPQPKPSPHVEKEDEPYANRKDESTWIERPITGTPGLAGHGSGYE